MIPYYLFLGFIFFVSNMLLNSKINEFITQLFVTNAKEGNGSRLLAFLILPIVVLWPLFAVLQMLSITKTFFKRS